jgi:hypothetical protein
MKALILNGAKGDSAEPVLRPLRQIFGSRGWDCDVLQPDRMNLQFCSGCFQCWTRTPGRCAHQDDGELIVKAEIHSDLIVFLSPVRWGSYSAEFKKALERSIPILLPYFEEYKGEIHHPLRYAYRPTLIALGIFRSSDSREEEIFRRLVHRNIQNLRPAEMAIGCLHELRPSEFAPKIEACLREAGILS